MKIVLLSEVKKVVQTNNSLWVQLVTIFGLCPGPDYTKSDEVPTLVVKVGGISLVKVVARVIREPSIGQYGSFVIGLMSTATSGIHGWPIITTFVPCRIISSLLEESTNFW